MSKTPRIDARKVSTVLEKHGYSTVRQSGSHRIYKNPEGIRITLPMHSGKIIHPKILNKISEDTGIINSNTQKKDFIRLNRREYIDLRT